MVAKQGTKELCEWTTGEVKCRIKNYYIERTTRLLYICVNNISIFYSSIREGTIAAIDYSNSYTNSFSHFWIDSTIQFQSDLLALYFWVN